MPTNEQPIQTVKHIALVGFPDAGKKTISGYFEERGFEVISINAPMQRAFLALTGEDYDVLSTPVGAKHFQDFCAAIIALDAGYAHQGIKRAIDRVASYSIIIDDIETDAQAQWAMGNGFELVHVQREWATYKAQGSNELSIATTHCAKTIHNNGTFQDLLTEVDEAELW